MENFRDRQRCLDPYPVCPERLDPDPVNIRPDSQPCKSDRWPSNYSVSTNFRLELIKPSAREVFLDSGRERIKSGEKRTWLKQNPTQRPS